MASSYNYHKPLGTDREEPQVDLYELGESCSQPQEHRIFFSVSFPHLFSHKLRSYSLAWHRLLITLLRRWEARRLGAWPGAIPEVPLSNRTAQAWPRKDSLKAACASLATEMSVSSTGCSTQQQWIPTRFQRETGEGGSTLCVHLWLIWGIRY